MNSLKFPSSYDISKFELYVLWSCCNLVKAQWWWMASDYHCFFFFFTSCHGFPSGEWDSIIYQFCVLYYCWVVFSVGWNVMWRFKGVGCIVSTVWSGENGERVWGEWECLCGVVVHTCACYILVPNLWKWVRLGPFTLWKQVGPTLDLIIAVSFVWCVCKVGIKKERGSV